MAYRTHKILVALLIAGFGIPGGASLPRAFASSPRTAEIHSSSAKETRFIRVTEVQPNLYGYQLCLKASPNRCRTLGNPSYDQKLIESTVGQLEHKIRQMSAGDYVALMIGAGIGARAGSQLGVRHLPKVSFRAFGEITGFFRSIVVGGMLGSALVAGPIYYTRWSTLKGNWIMTFESLMLKRTGRQVYQGDLDELVQDLQELLVELDQGWA